MGHLWQGRFASSAFDGLHSVAAVRYIELNSVRTRLATCAPSGPIVDAAVAGKG